MGLLLEARCCSAATALPGHPEVDLVGVIFGLDRVGGVREAGGGVREAGGGVRYAGLGDTFLVASRGIFGRLVERACAMLVSRASTRSAKHASRASTRSPIGACLDDPK
jgi:hypothetical protein